MITFNRLFDVAVIVVLVHIGVFAIGCDSRSSQPSASKVAHVERDVKHMLDRMVRAYESRDLDGVRSVLAGDDRFVWLEDGEPRYKSADGVIRALAGFPPGLAFSHSLRDVRIIPMSDEAAWAQLGTSTRIEQSGQVVSEFDSVVLMVVQRDQSGWRIIAAHTSSTKPRTHAPG